MKTLNFEFETWNLCGAVIALALVMCNDCAAQIQQAWVAKYNNGITNSTNQAVKMALDPSGNIFVTGFSQNTNASLGYVTLKYAPNGTQLWASRYDSTNYPSAVPAGLVLDNSNNVIVTGSALTVKYDSNGIQLWAAPYAGTALAIDTNGNVALTGFDNVFGIVKLNQSGSNLWLQTSPASCGASVGQAIVTDPDGEFYLAGSYPFTCERGVIDYELLIVKYGSNGNQIWTTSYEASGQSVQVEGISLDRGNNVYMVADFYLNKFVAIMYSANSNLNWVYFLTSTTASQAHGLALDSNLNFAVTGEINYSYNPVVNTFNYHYGTFKLNSNGTGIWTNYFPQPPFGSSVANAIAVDSAGAVYVTGYSSDTNSGNDIVTIKYDQNGNQIWLQRYSSPGNGNAAGNAIAVDKNGNVYVTGYDTTSAGGTEMVTIKYSPVILQRRSDGTVILQAQGSPGESFDIQASQDLLNWLDLGSVLADTNGLMQFDDTNAPAFPSRFYYTTPQ